MVKEINIYIEGGARSQDRAASAALRRGFSIFLTNLCPEIRAKNIKLNTAVVGSTELTCKVFTQKNEKSPDKFFVLLVDSDVAVDESVSSKTFLQNNPKLVKCDLKNVEEKQCHLMAQVMETWFLADVETLKSYSGKDFKENKLRKTANIEEIAKDDVLSSLKEATETKKLSGYHKLKDGGKLLEEINPQKVRVAAFRCRKLTKQFQTKSNNKIMEENICVVFHGFLNLPNLEKLKVVEMINDYFDSNDRASVRRANEEAFARIDTSAADFKCKCCGR